MQVLDKGQLGLVESMGSDRKIARAAWVSYGNQDSERTDEDVERVVRYMMKHRHGSPFEHVVMTFYVKAPIFVAREWFRHRIGSFNEISGRYKTLQPEFYIPREFRVPTADNKQGSQIPESNKDIIDARGTFALTRAYNQAYNGYLELKDSGIANELARMTLPVGLYTQWWWTVNLRSLFNFLSLRSDEKAQYEIRQYSLALEEITKELFPISFKAWEDNGRVAP